MRFVRMCPARTADKLFVASSVAIVILAAAVRLYASWDDFWLDEIWSWRFGIEATSYWQIATEMTHDSNHILNTWIIHSLPPDLHWTAYRIPAVLAGIGTVVLAGLCGLKRSRCEGMTALLLTGGSFVFIQYSSEARGYAYLLFFTMLCVWLMERMTSRPRRTDEWLFGLSASLGFLSHLGFVAAYGGLTAWTIANGAYSRRPMTSRMPAHFNQHALPVLTMMIWGVFWGGRMKIGGENPVGILAVLIQSGSLVLGGPDDGIVATLSCCAAVLGSIGGTILLYRHGHRAFYFIAGSSITLALTFLVFQPGFLFVRYFLIPIAAANLAICHLLASGWHRGKWSQIPCAIVVVLILAGNGIHTWRLLEFGRGGYREAVALMMANSKSAELTVSSDHDFRNQMLLSYYYYESSTKSKKLVYYPRSGPWPAPGPEWVILHSFEQPTNMKPTLPVSLANRYRVVKVFPYSGLSGWNWIICQRTDQ